MKRSWNEPWRTHANSVPASVQKAQNSIILNTYIRNLLQIFLEHYFIALYQKTTFGFDFGPCQVPEPEKHVTGWRVGICGWDMPYLPAYHIQSLYAGRHR